MMQSMTLDDFLAGEPIYPSEAGPTKVRCEECGTELYPEDEYFRLEGQILCEECAHDWLDGQRDIVTRSMAYG